MNSTVVSKLGKGAHVLDPEVAEAIATLPKPPPPPSGFDPDQFVLGAQPVAANAHKGTAALLPEASNMNIRERTIPVSGGEEISIRIYTPRLGTLTNGLSKTNGHSTQTYPVTVYLHAGGFCVGTLDTEEVACRAICGACTPSVVVNVGYRLAPTHRWPTAEEDCWDALKWVVENAGTELQQANLEKGIVLGGASAGAFITCRLLQRALQEPLSSSAGASPVRIVGQLLTIPMTVSHWPEPSADDIDSLDGISNEEKLILKNMNSYSDDEGHPDFPGLPVGRRPFAMYNGVYGPPPTPLVPEISPLLAPSTVFAKLPPAYIQVAGADPLKDDGVAYAKRLLANGVQARIEEYQRTPHAFYEFAPSSAMARKRQNDLALGVVWLISQGGE